MDDYISRQAAIACLYSTMESYYIKRNIMDLPAADVRPVVRGKWEEHGSMIDSYKRCSKCGVVMPIAEIPSWLYYNLDYCPNCGADMRE